jgi:hypothetical protein
LAFCKTHYSPLFLFPFPPLAHLVLVYSSSPIRTARRSSPLSHSWSRPRTVRSSSSRSRSCSFPRTTRAHRPGPRTRGPRGRACRTSTRWRSRTCRSSRIRSSSSRPSSKFQRGRGSGWRWWRDTPCLGRRSRRLPRRTGCTSRTCSWSLRRLTCTGNPRGTQYSW